LPGEEPEAYEKLNKSLFAEYNVSGCSEESTMTSIAKTMWQLQRLGIYEHVQYLRARGGPQSFANGKNPIGEAIDQFMAKRGLSLRKDSASDAPTVPEQPKEKSNDELLLELGNLVTLDHLDKELDVENKLMAKLDRLFKRFFQIKAMKPLMGEPPAKAVASTTPVLELTATDASKTSDEPGQTESVKSEVV
jgi:hypothetical protein